MKTENLELIHKKVANVLNDMIPVDWNKIYLYAEIDECMREVYFYFYPEGQNTPIYSLDVMDHYYIDEEKYEELDDLLLEYFTELWEEFGHQKQEKWTNLTYVLKNNGEFNIDYNYDDLSDVFSYEQKIIWMYKYMGLIVEGDRPKDIIHDYIESITTGDKSKANKRNGTKLI